MKTIYSTRPPVPVDALRLNEDIWVLGVCQDLLKTVDPDNLTAQREFGRELGKDIIRVTLRQLRLCQTYAETKLRKEYLAPRKRKIER